jgi:hypothetical protein
MCAFGERIFPGVPAFAVAGPALLQSPSEG